MNLLRICRNPTNQLVAPGFGMSFNFQRFNWKAYSCISQFSLPTSPTLSVSFFLSAHIAASCRLPLWNNEEQQQSIADCDWWTVQPSAIPGLSLVQTQLISTQNRGPVRQGRPTASTHALKLQLGYVCERMRNKLGFVNFCIQFIQNRTHQIQKGYF